MAIDTDRLRNGGKGFGTNPAHRTGTTTTPEGGGDMALALTSAVQSQANQLATAAQAAQLSIDHASDQMADYFTQVVSGKALLDATLAKTASNLEAMGGAVQIDTEVRPITLDLPKFGDFGSTRQRFLGLFNADPKPTNPFLAAAETPAADEVASDE